MSRLRLFLMPVLLPGFCKFCTPTASSRNEHVAGFMHRPKIQKTKCRLTIRGDSTTARIEHQHSELK